MLPGFLVASDNVPPSHRKCISPSSTKIMNQGADARLPDESRALLQVNQRGPGIATIMIKFPFQSPREPSGVSQWV